MNEKLTVSGAVERTGECVLDRRWLHAPLVEPSPSPPEMPSRKSNMRRSTGMIKLGISTHHVLIL